jgi:dolichol-phosphate mannosyltransferase
MRPLALADRGEARGDLTGVDAKTSVMQTAPAPVEQASYASSFSAGPELTVVVPTLNERDNIAPLVDRLRAALEGVAWEVIFVDDDSPDGTAEYVRSFAQVDSRVRCIQRIGRRGLATACIEGILASAAPYVAIIDADLQHDEAILLEMLESLRGESCDIAVGSRHVAGGSVGNWNQKRVRISGLATWLSRMICKADITDPMSGFFMLPRSVFDAAARRLSGQGFKILLDLIASSPRPLRIKELPYEFRERHFGESKFNTLAAWEFVVLIADKLFGHVVPIRFALFAFIGCIGLVIHLSVLWFLLTIAGMAFIWSQAAAGFVAMTANFFLNNTFTYQDMRLRGWGILQGLISFYAVCAFGAMANVGVAAHIFATNRPWWIAGITGGLVGAVWNYAVSSVLTWKR